MVGLIRADFSGVAPGVDGKQTRAEGGGEVHGTAVHADREGRAAEEPEEFTEGGAVEEVGGVFERREREVGAARENHPMRCERAAEFDHAPRENGWRRIKGAAASKPAGAEPCGSGHSSGAAMSMPSDWTRAR